MKLPLDRPPPIRIDPEVYIPGRSSTDESPAIRSQTKEVEYLVSEINLFMSQELDISAAELDALGGAQANGLIRELERGRARVVDAWRRSVAGSTVTFDAAGHRRQLTVTGSVVEEPTRKQIGYLKRLIADGKGEGLPWYIGYALDKQEASEVINAILGTGIDGAADEGESPPSVRGKGKRKSKNDASTGCGCLVLVGIGALTYYLLTL
jgi:hypothetical protein